MTQRQTACAVLGVCLVVALFGISQPSVTVGYAQISTNTPRVPPTTLPTNTPRVMATPSLPPMATEYPLETPRPSPTPRPTWVIEGTYTPPAKPPVTAIPIRIERPTTTDDVVTVLLLGSDTTEPNYISRTDLMVVVAINRTAGTVTMLHLPRDLMVYAPNDTMRKLNTVAAQGIAMYGAGGAGRLMKETLDYNFGIKVDFYARVGFEQFKTIIGALGGLNITVDCGIQGNRLINPDDEQQDLNDPANYEVYTMSIGKYTLSPYMALWYVRARGSTSDMDRGRRQIEVLRAMWRQSRDAGLLTQLTVLWPELQKIVETDMTLADVLGIAPLALSIDPVNIQRIFVVQNVHFTQWYTADTGSFSWLPKREAWLDVAKNLITPPRNRLSTETPRVAIRAATGWEGYAETAGDRLSWEGFAVSYPKDQEVAKRDFTVLIDYTGGAKPDSLETIRKALRLGEAQIATRPDPNAATDFEVIIGRDYMSSCLYTLPQ